MRNDLRLLNSNIWLNMPSLMSGSKGWNIDAVEAGMSPMLCNKPGKYVFSTVQLRNALAFHERGSQREKKKLSL